MAKVALRFKRGWSRYNAGDVAAFDEKQAQELKDAGVAKDAPPKPPREITVDLNVLPNTMHAEVKALNDQANRLSEMETEISDRARALAAREAEIERREAALERAESERGGADPDPDGAEKSAAEDKPAASGKSAPPKQGR